MTPEQWQMIVDLTHCRLCSPFESYFVHGLFEWGSGHQITEKQSQRLEQMHREYQRQIEQSQRLKGAS